MKTLKREISLYLVFGILTTLLSLVTYKLLLFYTHYMIATTLSTLIAILFAYITNRKYVFNSKGDVRRETLKFFIGRLIAYMIETSLLFVLITIFTQDAFLSKVCVTFLVVILNYIYSKLIVFKEAKSEKI